MKNSGKQVQEVEIVEEEVLTSDETVKDEEEIEEVEVVETIIVDDEDVEIKDSTEEEKEVTRFAYRPKEREEKKRDFVKEVKELSEEESEKIEKILEDEEKVKKEAQTKTVDLLTKFKEYISGNKFNKKCEEAGDKYNLSSTSIKNLFVKNTLGTIADILNLTVSIVGDIILGVSNFINIIICNIATYTSKTLHKIINIITFHCGEKKLC